METIPPSMKPTPPKTLILNGIVVCFVGVLMVIMGIIIPSPTTIIFAIIVVLGGVAFIVLGIYKKDKDDTFLADQLRELVKLRNEGLITAEEFEAKKRKLLGI